MAWLESHQTLANHPKTLKLSRLLNVPKAQAIGHLHLFWWWALDYAQDGALEKYDALDLAIAADWAGDPEEWLRALFQSGFINADKSIHDWDAYAGRLIERRRADAERKKHARMPKSNLEPQESVDFPPDVRPPSGGHPEDGARNTTVHNTTEPEEPPISPKGDSAPEKTGETNDAPKPKRPAGKRLDKENPYWHEHRRWYLFHEYWDQHPRKVAKDDAMRAWRLVLGEDDRDEDVMRAFATRFSRELEAWKRRDPEKIPHFATWINRRDWENDLRYPRAVRAS